MRGRPAAREAERAGGQVVELEGRLHLPVRIREPDVLDVEVCA